jgi:hypothetical protein
MIKMMVSTSSMHAAVIQTLDEEVAEAGRAAARLITRTSIVHRIDIFLRKVKNVTYASDVPCRACLTSG